MSHVRGPPDCQRYIYIPLRKEVSKYACFPTLVSFLRLRAIYIALYTSLLQSKAASGAKMMISGALSAISVVVSNLSCLALCSFFGSILPTKRNLLTHLNTVLVYALTALVNVLVSESQKHLKDFKE